LTLPEEKGVSLRVAILYKCNSIHENFWESEIPLQKKGLGLINLTTSFAARASTSLKQWPK